MNIGLFVSGDLGYNCISCVAKNNKIAFIATNKNSHHIVEYARSNSIPLFIGNPRLDRFKKFVGEIDHEFSLSINYLFLLDSETITRLKPIINFHGSLLPKYRGRTPHVWAIINNEQFSGVTAHYIDEGCDTGDILYQEKIPISPNDTGSSLLNKFIVVYPKVIKSVISAFSSNSLTRIRQDEYLASYFGKRTPEDGEINWNWDIKKINNFIRAQTKPYPGAFTKINGKKIIIWDANIEDADDKKLL